MNLTHVRLLVTRFSECFRFYRDVLGLDTKFPDEGPYAEFSLGGDRYLALFERELMAAAVDTASKPVDADAQDRVALIFEVPDVDAEAARLRELGISLAAEPADRVEWGLRTVHVRDPDGNLIELFSGLEVPHGG